MAKMWAGRTDGNTEKIADDFNSSIRFDCRMFKEDILGSIAHAEMLGKQGIISENEAKTLCEGLGEILEDIEEGRLAVDPSCEDIHMFVEQVLTERLGDVGKKLHTARSRNDQVALDLRMYLKNENDDIDKKLLRLIEALLSKAEDNVLTIMPGYTHLQRAQPVSFGQYMMAYVMMFLRDRDRLADVKKRTDVSPIGSCALAGTTYDTDRFYEAERLGFGSVCENSLDGVSDRDFCLELSSAISIIMTHLSRLSEEIVLWQSWEFKFIDLSDSYTTGSSIMPQKKNPDMAELVRGKTGRVFGDMTSLFTTMKGLPLAYNKDMQEDKEAIFDSCDTVKMCLDVMSGMIETMSVNAENMKSAAQKGFINATDLADYLVNKGLPFRSAYKMSGQIVAECISKGTVLEELPLSEYKKISDRFENDVYDAVDLVKCLERRKSFGGTSPSSLKEQIKIAKKKLGKA
ncbi:MAG: argininosuccinate lyase [Clostridia bacterium]|nr:argininosuccinate lyase [Clostridia bacterium]